jgi:hypothetical protein
VKVFVRRSLYTRSLTGLLKFGPGKKFQVKDGEINNVTKGTQGRVTHEKLRGLE